MSRRLAVVVDDLRSFPGLEDRFELLYARTSRSGCDLLLELSLSGRHVDLLLLDHDLGDETGSLDDILPVVDLLAESAFLGTPLDVGQVVVHSANPVGAATVVRSLERYYPVRRLPADSVAATSW